MFQEIHEGFCNVSKDMAESTIGLVERKEKLSSLVNKMNDSGLLGAIEVLFVRNYSDFADTKLRWVCDDEYFPRNVVNWNQDSNVMTFDHFSFLSFLEDCEKSEAVMNSRLGRADFRTYRLNSFLRELKKLPMKHLVFISVLREIARITEISKAERLRREKEEPNPPDVEYLTLLWAFKELETQLAITSHNNIRAEYKIFWYESEWIDS